MGEGKFKYDFYFISKDMERYLSGGKILVVKICLIFPIWIKHHNFHGKWTGATKARMN